MIMLKCALNYVAAILALAAVVSTSVPAHAFGPTEIPTVDGPGL
jgi:hypothetical protein